MRSIPPKRPVLLFTLGPEGFRISAVGEETESVDVPAYRDLLAGINLLLEKRGPFGGIVLAGRAARFSESRSVATIANTLALAWRAPVAAVAKPILEPEHAALLALLHKNQWPVPAVYSGEPNITKRASRIGSRK